MFSTSAYCLSPSNSSGDEGGDNNSGESGGKFTGLNQKFIWFSWFTLM